jgi:hypothetical protein
MQYKVNSTYNTTKNKTNTKQTKHTYNRVLYKLKQYMIDVDHRCSIVTLKT